MLHDRQGDAKNIGFLEGIGPNRGPGHLTGDHHHRHRIHLGRGDTRHQIGGSRAGSSETHPHLARGPGIGIRRMGATLLVPHQDVLQPAPGFRLVELVVDGQDRAAGIAKDVLHPMQTQGIHQGVATLDPHGGRATKGFWRGLGRRSDGRKRHGCCGPSNLAIL